MACPFSRLSRLSRLSLFCTAGRTFPADAEPFRQNLFARTFPSEPFLQDLLGVPESALEELFFCGTLEFDLDLIRFSVD